MKTQLKGLKIMKKISKISLLAVSLVIISCEIPADLNDNPNEITVSDVDANLFLNGAQLANVIVQVGAKPVLVDVDRSTYNLTYDYLINKINNNTKAIFVVHLFENVSKLSHC